MKELKWSSPDFSSISQIAQKLFESDEQGCDISPLNLFLYSQKYNTKISVTEGWLFRKYEEEGSVYYGFPAKLDSSGLSLKQALLLIKKDADACNCKALIFFATKKHLEQFKPEELPFSVEIKEDRNLADYLYLQEKLSNLAGSKLQKKRNHINQFIKKHPDCRFELLNEQNLSLALEVEEQWLKSFTEKNPEQDAEDLQVEKKLIEAAVGRFRELGLTGGIVLVQNKPVAMCIASRINSETTDIHFEKALDPFAKDGAYAFINRQFAQTITTKYINREEDLGLENLRKAKESYFPDLLLEKSCILLG